MKFMDFFSEQARKPSGLFGRFCITSYFKKGNAALNDLVFDTMAVRENEHLLEIGCGPGLLIRRIADSVSQGQIEGIDFSPPMVAAARKRNRKHLEQDKVKIHLGDFEQAVWEANRFDKIFSVNTIYFWKNPQAAMAKLQRILKPGGKLFIGFHDKEAMEKMPLKKEVFSFYSGQEMKELLAGHGALQDISLVFIEGDPNLGCCAVGSKAGA